MQSLISGVSGVSGVSGGYGYVGGYSKKGLPDQYVVGRPCVIEEKEEDN